MGSAAPVGKTVRRRRWPFVLLAIVFVLVVIAIGTEVAFRLFWRMPPVFAEFEHAGLYVAAGDGTIGFSPGFRGSIGVGGVRGIPPFDTTAVLAAEPEQAGLFVDDGGHFSVRGNQIVARWLAKEIAPLK